MSDSDISKKVCQKQRQEDFSDTEMSELEGGTDVTLSSCMDALALIDKIRKDFIASSKMSKQKKTSFGNELDKLSRYIQETDLNLIKTKASKFDEFCQAKEDAPRRSFASVVSSNTWAEAPRSQNYSHHPHPSHQMKQPSHATIVVKSISNSQLSGDTLLNKTLLQFKNTRRGIKVNRIRKAGNNVAIEVPTGQNVSDIIKAINEDVTEVSASLPKVKLPHVLIKGIPKYTGDLRQSALIDDLCNLNNYEKEDFDLSFTPFVLFDNSQRSTYDVVFRVKPRLYKTIHEQNYRCWIQNVCCHVSKHVNILQCRHCLGFGHTKNHCPGKAAHAKRCARCGEDRNEGGVHSCRKTECHNCKNHSFFKTKSFDHAADRVACPLFKLRFDTCDRETTYFPSQL